MTQPPSIVEIVEALRTVAGTFKGVHVEDPVVKRRSSVALILRFPALADFVDGPAPTLDALLDAIARRGSDVAPAAEYPEILFIKRTARKGDRWSGHVALPGGKRDPEDESDVACAARETLEEVGLDLAAHAHLVGPLDQRLVRTSWGRVTLMTLCPFVYILGPEGVRQSYGNKDLLTLQPTEIDRAFWIPVDQLYDPRLATASETVTLGDRLRLHKSPFLPKPVVSALCKIDAFGSMKFGAIDLVDPRDMIRSVPADPQDPHADPRLAPYKLWGLTQGIIVDLLELFQPHSAARYFFFPTLTSPDIRFFVYLLSYHYTSTKRSAFLKHEQNVKYVEGQLDITGKALAGYFPYLAKAIYLGLTFRAAVILAVVHQLIKRVKFLKRV